MKDGKVDHDEFAEYSELTRRLGFEYNGMVLHEYYFGNMKRRGAGDPEPNTPFHRAAEDSFGSYDIWKADFVGVGKMRQGSGSINGQEKKSSGKPSRHPKPKLCDLVVTGLADSIS